MKKIKRSLASLTALCILFCGYTNSLNAQCNVNDKYDKIISGYHSSIALKDNGVYCVWGSDMQKTGAADQLAPQDINATNYTGLTGTIYKAAMGGKSAGAAVDQAILLTSDGLWAWGIVGNVLKSTVKSTAVFGRITSPSGGVGSTALGLPTGVAPTDVASLFATYQTLIIVTKIVSGVGGDVYVLTQTTQAVEGNNGTAATAASSSWMKVKTGASTYLTNVTTARGQVYNNTNNAFMAVTATGQVYTWGNSTYLGDGSGIGAKTYAMPMTLPAEFASSVPKMIGVTGGGGTGATTVANTYYILSNAGNIYALGNNSQDQCGDFTALERTSWVQVKKSAAAGDYLTNINSFSCQEHNASFPTIAATTTTGGLYTWGNNSSGMCGRTDNGLITGGLTQVSFDPGTPVNFTGTAISVEVGGHTMVYTKTGSTQFCYVGHYTNGSMGDGTSGNNGSSSATSLKHDCSSTPAINICGYVPTAGSTVYSTISAAQGTIPAGGTSTTIITVRLKDASNNNLVSSGGIVTVLTSNGTVGTVTDNNDGTYSVVLTSGPSSGTATISFTINGVTATGTTTVIYTAVLPLTWLNVSAARQDKTVKVEWKTSQELNLSHFDVERSENIRDWTTVISGVPATNLYTEHTYTQTDRDYDAHAVYYRIKQTDRSGRFTYSAIVLVGADKTATDKFAVYPVPAVNYFYLNNGNVSTIKEVGLYTVDGKLIKLWKSAQPSYDVDGLAKGIYMLKITTTDNAVQFLKLAK